MSGENKSCDAKEQQPHTPTLLGWTVRLVSLGLLFALAAIIGLQIIQPDRDIAFDVTVKAADIRQQGREYLIPVEITNIGTATAREVNLQLMTPGETTDVNIKMLGQRETIKYVVSASAPVTTVTHKITSYEAP